MLKIMWIPNVDSFFTILEQCKGDVILHLPDNSMCSLKDDHMVQQLLRILKIGSRGIDISLSNEKDLPLFMKYMMESDSA